MDKSGVLGFTPTQAPALAILPLSPQALSAHPPPPQQALYSLASRDLQQLS